jgi:hypothetical protein
MKDNYFGYLTIQATNYSSHGDSAQGKAKDKRFGMIGMNEDIKS